MAFPELIGPCERTGFWPFSHHIRCRVMTSSAGSLLLGRRIADVARIVFGIFHGS